MAHLHFQRPRTVGAIAMAILASVACQPEPEPMLTTPDTVPNHVHWARELVDNIEPEYNAYGSNPSFVRWAGVDGSLRYESRSVCGTFVTHVLRQAYGLPEADVTMWSGRVSPNAAAYHDAIVAEGRFERVHDVNRIQAGDIIAIKYPEGGEDSGHVGIIVEPPAPRAAIGPHIPGTSQYDLAIVDSSKSGHGATDTRRNPDGSWHPGAGMGAMRLYADESGRPVGYTWSTHPGSTYHAPPERPLVVGRLR